MSKAIQSPPRRTLLKLAAITPLALSVQSCNKDIDLTTETITQELLKNLNHINRAREIGLTYIEETPTLATVTHQQVTEQILTLLNLDVDKLNPNSFEAMDTMLRKRVRQDFVDENVVILKGWMLSQTETLLCALAAIYLPAPSKPAPIKKEVS